MTLEPSIKKFFRRTPTIVLVVLIIIFAIDTFRMILKGDTSGVPIMRIPLIPLVLYWLYYTQKIKIETFSEWLKTNIDSFTNQQALVYNGKQITKDTELVEYEMVLSILFLFTFIFPSGKMIPEYHNTTFFRVLFGCISAVCGWWCIPWGIMATPRVLYWNIKGGKKYTIHSLTTEEGKKQLTARVKSRFVFFF